METKELQFKTKLNCSGCVAKVKADLDSTDGICDWNVDTENSNKVLTVQSNGNISEKEVIDIIKKKGFKAESLID